MKARNVGIALAALALWPAAASAAIVSSDGRGVRYVALDGERNDVFVDEMTVGPTRGYQIVELSFTPLIPGVGCVLVDRHKAYCVTTEAQTHSTIELGDGDDLAYFYAEGATVEIRGGSGSDQIGARLPVATLVGGTGDDILGGGANDDLLLGGEGDDSLWGWAGDDVLRPGPGADEMRGEWGQDWVQYDTEATGVTASLDEVANDGLAGEDHIESVERLSGAARADTLTGDARDNRLHGGEGDDRLVGLGGKDVFDAGGGADLIEAIDGIADTGACGDGFDIAFVDPVDALSGCEDERL